MIKMLVMDVDGTLTDGKIYTSSTGECMKAFNVKDGYGIKKLCSNHIVPVVITGRKSEIVQKRCDELNILEVYQGIEDKLEVLRQLVEKYLLEPSQVAYIGDDENDLECMKYCGVTGCPSDAAEKVIKATDFVASVRGGNGAVREFIEWILEDKTDETDKC